MKKWLLRILYAALVLLPIGAIADYTATPGSGSTVFAFVCFTSKICPAHVLTNSSGTEIATSGNPVRTDPTGTTPQPVTVASGAAVDGWSATDGSKTDSPASLPTSGTGVSKVAIEKAIANALNSILSAATTPLSNSSVPINVSTATTTQLVALSGSTVIYVTSYDVIAGGTGNITFEYGTGSNCGTGTTVLTGAYPLTAQAGISKGSGIGTVLKVPAGNALCVLTSAGVQMSGSVSYQQF